MDVRKAEPGLGIFAPLLQVEIKNEEKPNVPLVGDNEPEAVSVVCGEASPRQDETSESEIPRRQRERSTFIPCLCPLMMFYHLQSQDLHQRARRRRGRRC